MATPLPLEHIQTNPCVSGINRPKDESKHFDASFIINLSTSSTPSYVSPTIAKPNSCNANDHGLAASLDPTAEHWPEYATR